MSLVDDMLQWVCGNDLACKVLIRYIDIAGNDKVDLLVSLNADMIVLRFEIRAHAAYENGL